MLVEPVIIEGERVRLAPLTLDHLDSLAKFALNQDLWRWRPHVVRTREDLRCNIQSALDLQETGKELCFVIVERALGQLVGSTRYMNIEREHRRVEIGGTFIAPAWQRTYVNTESKYLMLKHAFEVWKCIRVELKTDSLNERSRRAILRLGVKEEGTFRNHMIMPDGRIRHSVYFSIIDSEWSAIKRELENKLHPTLSHPPAFNPPISQN
jgi:N-acetyltransferase